MGIFVFILIIMVLSGIVAPIAKGLGDRLAKGAPNNKDLAQLRAELERADERLAEAERRLQLAEERMDFQEKLLSSRSSGSRLPPVGS
jgi:division protein CdvB (Snf7/Vps24/ESCRT-III family)